MTEIEKLIAVECALQGIAFRSLEISRCWVDAPEFGPHGGPREVAVVSPSEIAVRLPCKNHLKDYLYYKWKEL